MFANELFDLRQRAFVKVLRIVAGAGGAKIGSTADGSDRPHGASRMVIEERAASDNRPRRRWDIPYKECQFQVGRVEVQSAVGKITASRATSTGGLNGPDFGIKIGIKIPKKVIGPFPQSGRFKGSKRFGQHGDSSAILSICSRVNAFPRLMPGHRWVFPKNEDELVRLVFQNGHVRHCWGRTE